jgi:hypothetical protein
MGLVIILAILNLFTFADNTTSLSPNPEKVLILVPGLGSNESRANIVLNNMNLISRSQVDFECLIFVYSNVPSNVFEQLKYNCSIDSYQNGNYADYIKAVSPSLVKLSKFTHVMVLLDDVELEDSFQLIGMLEIMQRHNLSVASPCIRGAALGATSSMDSPARRSFHMKPVYKVGHYSQVIEVFSTIFTVEGWHCFWSLVDPTLNQAGWGYDLYLYHYCRDYHNMSNFTMGVIHSMTARHHKGLGRLEVSPHSCRNMNGCIHPSAQRDRWIEISKQLYNLTLIEGDRNKRGRPFL